MLVLVAETQQYVTGLGGIEATVAAMQHCGCVEVLIVGCGTLTCLAMTGKCFCTDYCTSVCLVLIVIVC